MKKIYLVLFVIAVFGMNKVVAQNPLCPEFAFVVPLPTEEIYVVFDPDAGPPCVNRPATITVDGGASTYTLNMGTCTDGTSQYQLTAGPGVVDPNNFTIVYNDGVGISNCTYTGGVLPIESFEFLNATLRVFPNPLMKQNDLSIKLATNISADIYLYDLTGKLAFADKINNSNIKKINTSSLTNGVYLLRMVTDYTAITRKVVIMK